MESSNHWVLFINRLVLVDHLNEYFLGILKAFVHARVSSFQITRERELLDLSLAGDKSHHSISTAQNQLRLVLEEHLDNLVRKSKQNSLLSSFPLLQITL